MKKIICLASTILLVSSLNLISQTAKENQSNAEIFESKPGALIETQFIEVGFVDLIELRVMKIKDINSGTAKSALRFEYQTSNQIISHTKLAVVDEDELEGLMDALNTLIFKAFKSEKKYYTEITFQSRSGFVAGGYYMVDKKKWMSYIQLNKSDSKSTVTLSIDEFENFLNLLKQAKEIIQTPLK